MTEPLSNKDLFQNMQTVLETLPENSVDRYTVLTNLLGYTILNAAISPVRSEHDLGIRMLETFADQILTVIQENYNLRKSNQRAAIFEMEKMVEKMAEEAGLGRDTIEEWARKNKIKLSNKEV
jgi:hypothetical protein